MDRFPDPYLGVPKPLGWRESEISSRSSSAVGSRWLGRSRTMQVVRERALTRCSHPKSPRGGGSTRPGCKRKSRSVPGGFGQKVQRTFRRSRRKLAIRPVRSGIRDLKFRRWTLGAGARAGARFGFSPLEPPLGNENPPPGVPVREKEYPNRHMHL